MSYLDRSRVPPDVARRLAALAASSDDDDPPGVPPGGPGARGVATVGWTPRPPAAPTGAGRRDTGGTVPLRPHPQATEVGDDAPRPPQVPVATDAGPERWQPNVTSALATAAAAVAPVPRPRVRWVPGWRTTGAAVLVLALVAGALVLRAAATPRGEPVTVPVPAVGSGGVPGGGPAPTGTPAGPERVVVHVVGAVVRPGVVHLPLGARVGDAVTAAGGSGADADLAGLNLARVVADGEQLVVPVVGAALPAPAAPVASDLVDLNTADEAALQELPGVGPVLAGRIVQHRAGRPFTTVDELDDVPGVGPALMADLRPRVRV